MESEDHKSISESRRRIETAKNEDTINVDNHSRDGSYPKLQAATPDNLSEKLKLPKNIFVSDFFQNKEGKIFLS